MIVIRIGEGQSETGKILDYNTQWFTNKKEAIEYHLKTKKPIFISYDKRRYLKINLDKLIQL